MSVLQTPDIAKRAGTAHRRRCCQSRMAATAAPGRPRLFRRAGLAFCLTLGLACGTQAAEPDENRRSDKEPGKPAPAEPPPKPKQNAPRPFVPTEKIKADSLISFPVDI